AGQVRVDTLFRYWSHLFLSYAGEHRDDDRSCDGDRHPPLLHVQRSLLPAGEHGNVRTLAELLSHQNRCQKNLNGKFKMKNEKIKRCGMKTVLGKHALLIFASLMPDTTPKQPGPLF